MANYFRVNAAEVIAERADHKKENMGLMSWQGDNMKRTDITVAKNYLTRDELKILNRIVTHLWTKRSWFHGSYHKSF